MRTRIFLVLGVLAFVAFAGLTAGKVSRDLEQAQREHWAPVHKLFPPERAP